VDDLVRRFDVTPQTIRRDLSDLAESGKIDRLHGGAVPRSGVSNIGYHDRQVLNADAKAAIAAACAAEVPDNASVLLNIGTTTEAVARALLGHRNLTVVTNNLNVATTLAGNDSAEVIVAGGVLRRSDGGLVGDLAEEAMGRFKPDIAIIGASAIDADGDLLDYDLQEVRVSRTIVRQSRRVFLVADRSKFRRAAPVRIASLAEIDTVFTDRMPGKLARRCAEWETRVIEAPAL
jgi:DeoR family glycerol-3-phosphate regulon repressor